MDFPVSELRKINVYFRVGSHVTQTYIHASEVEKYVKCLAELHYEPGINPYNVEKTATISHVESCSLVFGEYWHATPGLGKDKTQTAVSTGEFWKSERVWTNPDTLKEEYERDLLED